jgi:RNA polymerase sigma-70 factor (ECF subfamily)
MSRPWNYGEMAGVVERAIAAAREGNRPELGKILEVCRNYLLLTANEELEPDLQTKIAPSDVVQKTYLEACRDFGQFRGHTEADLLGWLRGILRHNLANVRREFRSTGKRLLRREQPLVTDLEQLPHDCLTPGAVLVGQEERRIVVHALEQLPEHYREVLRLRQQENCSFPEIGERMGKSAEGARKLWARAIEQLKDILKINRLTL